MHPTQRWLFEPEDPIPPGAKILELLQEKGMTQTQLAARMGRPLNKINEIIKGKRAITPDTAHSLELVLGLSADDWMKLESKHQLIQKRFDFDSHFREESQMLKRFPLREMMKFGWLQKGEDNLQTTRNLLKFFGVTSFENLENPSVMLAAFRKSQVKDACSYALAAWLREGTIEAEKIRTGDFSRSGLHSSISELRSLSLLNQDQFVIRLNKICVSNGIAFVLVPHLPKSYASGAAYWIGDKAIIQLSFRFGTNDHFWFTFFHELGHILLHGKSETFLDKEPKSGCSDDPRETQANEFSRSCLIPPDAYERLKRLNYHQASVVKSFAREIGIAPGIVVGRLQHDDLLHPSVMNKLKTKIIQGHL